MVKGYSAEAAKKAREVSKKEKENSKLPPEKQITKIPVSLREVIITLSGYETGTGNYYGLLPKERVYRYSFPDPVSGKEYSDTFRAANRVRAKEFLARVFQDSYKGKYVPKYHN